MPPAPEPRLSEQEFQEVVGEIAKDQASGVSQEEARVALRELDLPADKLDEATAKVRERRAAEALAEQTKKRQKWMVAGALATLLTVGVAVTAFRHSATVAIEKITAVDPKLLDEAGQTKLSVKLMNAPKGDAVPMSCAWRSPEGKLLHENVWSTKAVTHDAWETHCVLKQAPPHLKVEMKAHGRTVAESSR